MAMHIFVVDDNETNLQVAGHILRKNGYRVTLLDSGRELLSELTPADLPDLILLDIKMPEMDGFAALSQLRAKEQALGIPEIPVIFLTADETADTEKQGFEAGVSDYIRKPFDPDILLRRVHNIITKEKRLHVLRTEAETDKLTGLLNKAAVSRLMPDLCASDLGCLLIIDLDSFKLVNDLYGHSMGDHVLISFSAILRSVLPEPSKIGRIGGDEFIAFISGLQSEEEVCGITERLNAMLVAKAKELMGDDLDIPLGASVGAVFVPQHGDTYDGLFMLADKCLYNVKKNGKHGCSVCHGDAAQEEAADPAGHDIGKLSEILSERSIPNVALQLNKEAFSYVYRYIMRCIVRNQLSIYKVLVTLSPEEGVSDAEYKEICDHFGNHIRESLRKTDILMRNRYNQYFILLTDIRQPDIGIVTGNIMRRWERSGGHGIRAEFTSEFVTSAEPSEKKAENIQLAVVDDDETNLRVAGTVLSKAGFRVSAMKSGKALLKYLADRSPDLILLDVQMPDMDGFETMRELRRLKNGASVPVVFLSASDHENAERTGMQLGAEDFIRKPFLPELLVQRVRRITELAAFRRSMRGRTNG